MQEGKMVIMFDGSCITIAGRKSNINWSPSMQSMPLEDKTFLIFVAQLAIGKQKRSRNDEALSTWSLNVEDYVSSCTGFEYSANRPNLKGNVSPRKTFCLY